VLSLYLERGPQLLTGMSGNRVLLTVVCIYCTTMLVTSDTRAWIWICTSGLIVNLSSCQGFKQGSLERLAMDGEWLAGKTWISKLMAKP